MSAVDNKKCTIGVFRLKKNLDIIDHMLLLTKLEHCGIRGVAYDWIKRYLCERKQYVSLNICYSDAMNVVCGVPRGSILGPKLVILYVNDISNVSSFLSLCYLRMTPTYFCQVMVLRRLVRHYP